MPVHNSALTLLASSRSCNLTNESEMDSKCSYFLISFCLEQHLPQYFLLDFSDFMIKLLFVLFKVLSKRVSVSF